ncbi:MAG: dienelactone hydrolase family protein [Acidimicrobiales bacterium]
MLVAAACSSSSSDGKADQGATTSAPASTTVPAKADPAYEEMGPDQVGTLTLALDDGRRVVVWYPAAASAADQPKETFDIASLLAPALQAKIPADLRPQYEIDAHPGADPATDGPYPVVLFSHGFAGFPEQSADLVTHLASWGFVVVAPDHVERSLSGLLGTAAQGVPKREDTEVLASSLDAAVAEAKAVDSPLHDLLDLSKVAVTGHSAGAGAAYLLAAKDPRIKAFISYSLGDGRRGPNEAAPKLPIPKVPGMVMLGTEDGIIEPSTTKRVYRNMEPPKYLVQISGAGHLVFSDICLIGKGDGGLLALADQAGIDLPANLKVLASDGCEEDKLDPSKAFGAIDHFSVAFLRYELGIDPEPVGMDQATAASFVPTKVRFSGEAGPPPAAAPTTGS